MNKLILTVGISNSGKTSWVEKLKSTNPNICDVNRDEIRARNFTKSGRLQDYKYSKAKEREISCIQEQTTFIAKRQGFDVVISDTNLNPKTREKWKEFARKHQMDYEEVVFNVEPHICKKRNINREYSVPPEVIDKQYVQFREYIGLPTKYEEDENLPPAVVVDIDGTIADMSGVRGAFEWDKVGNDKPHTDIIDLVRLLWENNYHIIFMSGRDSCCRINTIEWLNSYFPDVCFNLYMRGQGILG